MINTFESHIYETVSDCVGQEASGVFRHDYYYYYDKFIFSAKDISPGMKENKMEGESFHPLLLAESLLTRLAWGTASELAGVLATSLT